MRAAASCLALGACAAAPITPDRAVQSSSCDRAVADHVALPVEAVATTWRAADADGVAVFEARDGGRMHLCSVDAAGSVLRLDHP